MPLNSDQTEEARVKILTKNLYIFCYRITTMKTFFHWQGKNLKKKINWQFLFSPKSKRSQSDI